MCFAMGSGAEELAVCGSGVVGAGGNCSAGTNKAPESLVALPGGLR